MWGACLPGNERKLTKTQFIPAVENWSTRVRHPLEKGIARQNPHCWLSLY
jgi:hypothetical protein